MKKVLLSFVAAAVLCSTPALSADLRLLPAPQRVAAPVADCTNPVPGLAGLAGLSAIQRSTWTFNTTKLVKTVKYIKVYKHHHVYYKKVVYYQKVQEPHQKSATKFNVGQYLGTAVAAAAVNNIVGAALTPCRQLTLAEAYANTADAFLPIVGGMIVHALMPDTPETIHIATLAKQGVITNAQALDMYAAAYKRH